VLRECVSRISILLPSQVVRWIFAFVAEAPTRSRKRLVGAVCLQAVDHFLVSGKTNPLWIFSPHFISNMSDVELHSIAGDEDETLKRRNMLETELASLKAGEKILEI
jgi:hypothetical protein